MTKTFSISYLWIPRQALTAGMTGTISGRRCTPYGSADQLRCLVFSPRGNWAASIVHVWPTTELIIWDTESGIPVHTDWYEERDRFNDLPHRVAFSPNEAQSIHVFSLPLATSSTPSGKIPQKIGCLPVDATDARYVGVLWSLDGTQMFVQDALARVHVFDASTFAHLRSLLVPSSELAAIQHGCSQPLGESWLRLSSAGDCVLSTLRFTPPPVDGTPSNYTFVWDLSTGTCRYKSTDDHSPIIGSTLWNTTHGEDQFHVISVCEDGTLRNSKVASTGEHATIVTQLSTHSNKVTDTQSPWFPSSPLSADGARLMMQPDFRRSLLVVDTMTGSAPFRLDHAPDIYGMEWSADGRTAIFVAEENDVSICSIWNIEEGTTKTVFWWPDGRSVHLLAISADGVMVGISNRAGDVVFRRVSDPMASAWDP
ncbi:uncharacterized protein BXZ73DRAFT_76261 [Epithele typhae]|uniref:uncharacterized protein n=1 Tax=Epithele typhae TaxID=378194 RepID=UPI002007CCEA|nr:uncharacterized protein BXZ73DRAFT_76261 [Epithele typhae]KAH9938742.1 hypothetical protein BXZ73DRAFT_76261 [Epithele typhae]